MYDVLNQNKGEYFVIGHHQSHAANAFFSSNYDESLIITIDGSGTDKVDWKDTKKDVIELGQGNYFSTSFTFWKGKGLDIEPIERIPMQKLTIGSPWRVYTREIFGLSSGHPHGLAAGTVMAMRSMGDPEKYKYLFDKIVPHEPFVSDGDWSELQNIVTNDEQVKFDIADALQEYTNKVIKELIGKYLEQ